MQLPNQELVSTARTILFIAELYLCNLLIARNNTYKVKVIELLFEQKVIIYFRLWLFLLSNFHFPVFHSLICSLLNV